MDRIPTHGNISPGRKEDDADKDGYQPVAGGEKAPALNFQNIAVPDSRELIKWQRARHSSRQQTAVDQFELPVAGRQAYRIMIVSP